MSSYDLKFSNSALVVVTALILASLCFCGQASVDPYTPEVDSFPLKPGDKWEYRRDYYEISLSHQTAETLSYSINRQVKESDTLFPGISGLKIVEDSISIISGIMGFPYFYRYWFKLEHNKLKEYAYEYGIYGGNSQPRLWADPHVVLDFPLVEGKSWLLGYMDIGASFRNVVGADYFLFDDRVIFCEKIKTTNPGIGNIEIYDWYADEGLIFNSIDYGIREITNEIGQPIDSVHAFEETKLVNLGLASD